jgi:uncharacterized protein YndB with AHSA1/START domain
MPVKKDAAGKHWVEMEFLVPGTPEQVWAAMATGPGNTAWFTKTTIEGRVGGELRFHFGPDTTSSGEVTAWEPPKLFGYVERGWAPDAPPVATEITITSRAGGKCVVRMVHSLFAATDEWDDQLEGFESGWPGFFAVLRLYLAHFADSPAASFMTMSTTTGTQAEVWKRYTEALNLVGANVGDRREIDAPVGKFAGTVELVHQDEKVRMILIRLHAPAPGVALIGTYGAGDKVNASATVYFYGDAAETLASASELVWRTGLSELFPANS